VPLLLQLLGRNSTTFCLFTQCGAASRGLVAPGPRLAALVTGVGQLAIGGARRGHRVRLYQMSKYILTQDCELLLLLLYTGHGQVRAIRESV